MNESMLSSGVVDEKYQIVRQLGAGGMGAVYEARHLGTGRRVAVKVILSDALQKQSDALARFQREARAAGAIESLHIADVLDVGIDRVTGHPYMVMEYLAGEDLQRALKRLGPLSAELALRVVAQACLGLQRAHEAGVVHRDIKPANIFLAAQDAGGVLVKLLDFGIAKVKLDRLGAPETGSLTVTGSVMGSPHYMSPEQAVGAKEIDHRTDVWSLGVVLYEALCGRSPFAERETLGSLILAIYSEPPQPIQERAPWLSQEVAAIVHRALARDAAARFQSAAEMYAAISGFLPQGHALTESMFVPTPPPAVAAASTAATAAASATAAAGATAMLTSWIPPAVAAPAIAVSARPGPRQELASSPPPHTGGGIVTPVPSGSRRSRFVAVMAAGAGVAVLVGAGVIGLHRTARPPAKVEGPAAASQVASAPAAPVVSLAVPLSAAPIAAPDAGAVTLAAGRLDTPHAVDAGPSSAAATGKGAGAGAGSHHIVHGGAGEKQDASSARGTGCDPNFYLDDQGEKHFKPECFGAH